MTVQLDVQTPSASELEQIVYGRTVPRVYTMPLRDVDNDEDATLGFDVIDFAYAIGLTLFPWQEWWLKHALELKADGTLRFSTVLTLISRQNGKTFLLKLIALYFLYRRKVRLVLGVAQDMTTARESLMGALETAEDDLGLALEFMPNPRGRHGYEAGSGRELIKLKGRRRYMIKAATGKAGRGLSVDVLILDELREWRDALAWAALSKTVIARPGALTLAISNAGDDESVILNNLRAAALGTNDRIAVFEWSAPDGCDMDDMDAIAQANPALGHGTLTIEALLDALATDPPGVFRTECLCQRVQSMDQLVNEAAWRNCADATMTLDGVKRRVALCLDVSPDGQHATLVAAAVRSDDKILAEVVKAWSADRMARLPAELKAKVALVRPSTFGWFPAGPAAAYAQAIKGIKKSEEINQPTAACMGLITVVDAQGLVHADDPLMTNHILGVKKLDVGDGWRFVRKGTGHCDAAYATAGAVYLAQSLPKTEPGGGSWVV